MTLFNILESLLPATLPYPVLSIIAFNVLLLKGFDKIDQVTKKDLERKCMERLFFSLADIFTLLKVFMFNTETRKCRTVRLLKLMGLLNSKNIQKITK